MSCMVLNKSFDLLFPYSAIFCVLEGNESNTYGNVLTSSERKFIIKFMAKGILEFYNRQALFVSFTLNIFFTLNRFSLN